jgi:hypothetical protein
MLPRFSLRWTITFYESATFSKKTLCQLQDREAQKRRARDLQKPAPQTAARMTLISQFNDFSELTI